MSSVDDPIVPPLAALALAVVAVSTSAILVELSEAPRVLKAGYRVLFTTALVAPFAVRNRRQFASVSGTDWALISVAGVLLAVHFAAWFASIEFTSIAASTTLVQTQPVFVALGAWLLLDERVGARIAGGILVAIAGSILLSTGDFLTGGAVGPAPNLGNALAVLGSIAGAGYVLAGRSVRQRLSLAPYVFAVYGVCTLALFAVAIATELPLLGYPPREWVLFVGMAVGPGLFGHTVVNWALKYVESSVVSVSLLGEPVVSTLLALAIFGEVPGLFTVIGGAVVLLGIAVTTTDRGT